MAAEYPEHAKLKKVQPFSQRCMDFIEWLQDEKHIVLRSFLPNGDTFFPIQSTDELLHEFFEIDRNKIEDEKQSMLAEIRAANESRTIGGVIIPGSYDEH